jgi:ubiquinone/menaquinone biosynthesis C-methylase UbiE/organic radical activating enzyme
MADIQLINIDQITNRKRTPLTIADVDPAHAYRVDTSDISFDKDLQLKGKYCYHPFNTVTIDTRGECFVCVCQAWLPISVGNILDFASLDDIVHSPRAREIQASIIDGTYKYCDQDTCHIIKSSNLETRIAHRPDTVNWIVFAIDDSCNLSCPSCRTDLIFYNKGEEFDHRMKISTHITKLIQNHHQFLRFTLSGDGDPFASHVYRNILENLQLGEDDPVEIEIVTNGILVKSQWDRMTGIHNHVVRFKISFDAGSQEVYNITRRGGDWNKLIESTKYITKWKQKYYSKMQIVSNFVLQTTNYKDIHKYVQLADELGVDEISFQNVVDWGKWDVNGVNHFVEHAVWMPSHPDHQEFINLLNDPIMQNSKITPANFISRLAPVSSDLTLASLIKFRNSVLLATNTVTFQENLFILKNKISDNLPAKFDHQAYHKVIDDIAASIKQLDTFSTQIIDNIDNNINSVSETYHTRGYKINGYYATDATNVEGELFRVLTMDSQTREVVLALIAKCASWEYPGLEIGPGTGDWTEHMVACEPLYLLDVHLEFLNQTKNRFTPEYQRKICSYVTTDNDLSVFPKNQMGFIFSWNVFNYLTLDIIEKYLEGIYDALRPGGTCIFSYNNAERVQCAKYVDEGFMSYVPKTLLLKLINAQNYEIVDIVDTEEHISWVEIKKPGKLSTIKRHASLGQILAK